MRHAFLTTMAAVFCVVSAPAQDRPWITEATGTLSLVQAGFHNWQEGGLSSFALTTGLVGSARQEEREYIQQHVIRLGFGLVKQDSLAVRKAEDIIDLQSAFSLERKGLFAVLKPTLAVRFRSQFAEGFDHGKHDTKKVSAFLAPATFQQSLGLSYQASEFVRQRVGLSAKQTVVTIQALRERYGVDPGRYMRQEAGLESYTEFAGTLAKNVDFASKLLLFASVNQPGRPDALLETLVTLRVNQWLQVKFEHVVLYDADIRRAVQMKEVLSVGFSVRFI